MQRRHVVQYGAAGAGALALMLGVGWWRVLCQQERSDAAHGCDRS